MPYSLLPFGFNKWRVCKTFEPETCFSKKGLSKKQASKQMKAIIISESQKKSGKGDTPVPKNIELYNKIKDEVYKQYPTHSLYRSALIVKRYKNEGGEYETTNEPQNTGINKWFKENWLSANDFLRGDVVKCGDNNAEKYNEYPLCYAEKRLKKFTKKELKELIKEKTDLREKHLPTKELTGKGDRELYKLYPSTVKNRKWDLYYEKDGKVKKVSFGHPDYEDYTQHHDKQRRTNYLTRTANMRGEWKGDPWSRNNLSREILWGNSIDIQKNLNDYLKKMGIK